MSIEYIEKLFERDFHLTLSGYEREITELSKEFERGTGGDNGDIELILISKNPEYIEIAESSGVLIILISESIFKIVEMIISFEIIIKKPSSSNYNFFSSFIGIDPELGLTHWCCFSRTYCDLWSKLLGQSIEKEIIWKDDHTPRMQE